MWCLNHPFSANSDLQKGFVHGWNDRQFCKSCSSSRFNSGMEWIFEVYILIIIFSWFKRYKIFLCIYIGMYFYLSDISKSERMFFILRLSKNPNFHLPPLTRISIWSVNKQRSESRDSWTRIRIKPSQAETTKLKGSIRQTGQ